MVIKSLDCKISENVTDMHISPCKSGCYVEVTRRSTGRDDNPNRDVIAPSRRDDGTRRNAN
jgi:hypothetical protein